MIYTFTESDITTLGITDEAIKNVLLKTSIVDSGYNGGLEMYNASRKPQFHCLGGVDVRLNTGYSILISLLNENNRTKITSYSDTQIRVGSENLSGAETYNIFYTYGTIGRGGGSNNNASAYTITISELSNLYIKGRTNIFGIVYDGDKTLTYGDKSITIDVYDDDGLTIKGQKGVKGIVYNGNRVKELVLNGVSHILNDKIICSNGVELPKPPIWGNLYGDKLNHWLIRENTEYYDLVYSCEGMGYYDGSVCAIDGTKLSTSSSVAWYRLSKTSPTNYWEFYKSTTGNFSLTDKALIASVDDVKVWRSTSTQTNEIYFAKTHDD